MKRGGLVVRSSGLLLVLEVAHVLLVPASARRWGPVARFPSATVRSFHRRAVVDSYVLALCRNPQRGWGITITSPRSARGWSRASAGSRHIGRWRVSSYNGHRISSDLLSRRSLSRRGLSRRGLSRRGLSRRGLSRRSIGGCGLALVITAFDSHGGSSSRRRLHRPGCCLGGGGGAGERHDVWTAVRHSSKARAHCAISNRHTCRQR